MKVHANFHPPRDGLTRAVPVPQFFPGEKQWKRGGGTPLPQVSVARGARLAPVHHGGTLREPGPPGTQDWSLCECATLRGRPCSAKSRARGEPGSPHVLSCPSDPDGPANQVRGPGAARPTIPVHGGRCPVGPTNGTMARLAQDNGGTWSRWVSIPVPQAVRKGWGGFC